MGPQRVSTSAVADAGPLIHLDEIDSLGLLDALDRLYVPETVYEELAEGSVPAAMTDLDYELVTPDETDPVAAELDAGETAALTVAAEYDVVLLTDDMAAREAATGAGVEVHGSLGVIALAFGRGRIDRDQAAHRMRALQHETSLFVSEAVVERGIEMLEED